MGNNLSISNERECRNSCPHHWYLSLKFFLGILEEVLVSFFKTANFEGSSYKCSLYFVGAKLWDFMPEDDLGVPDVFAFKARLKRLNKVYVVLLSR